MNTFYNPFFSNVFKLEIDIKYIKPTSEFSQETLPSLVNSKTLLSQPWNQAQTSEPNSNTTKTQIYHLIFPSNPNFYLQDEIQALFSSKCFKPEINSFPTCQVMSKNISLVPSSIQSYYSFKSKSSQLNLYFNLKVLTGATRPSGKLYIPYLFLFILWDNSLFHNKVSKFINQF